MSLVIHTDCTNGRVNGKGVYIYVCATPDGKVIYSARNRKVHEGIKGTVVENYEGILIHDHDKAYYRYSSNHQECNVHILRYLKDSIDNEQKLCWNRKMRSLIQEMIHYRNSLAPGDRPDANKVNEFEARYDEVIKKGEQEYEDNPPKQYYRDGFNLLRRLKKYKNNYLLFLHNMKVPADNNLSERLLRNFKRKMAQAISFRSSKSLENLCSGMSVLASLRNENNGNTFLRCAEIFNS